MDTLAETANVDYRTIYRLPTKEIKLEFPVFRICIYIETAAFI
jgi:hypothetical protein